MNSDDPFGVNSSAYETRSIHLEEQAKSPSKSVDISHLRSPDQDVTWLNASQQFHHRPSVTDTEAIISSNEVEGNLLLLFALLVLINLIVILGNILVIIAVYATAKLRNVTNIFTVSLATADLLLGIFVLPYAVMFEVSS